MDSKDFSFLYRKEILILGCFLLALTFVLIAIEQQSHSSITPILILNFSLLDILGLFLPIITLIVLFVRVSSLRNSTRDFLKYIYGARILYIFLPLFLSFFFLIFIIPYILALPLPPPIPIPLAPEFPIIYPTFNTPDPFSSFSSDLLSVFGNFRTVFFIIVFFLMLLTIVIILIRRGKTKIVVSDISDDDGYEDQKTQAALNVLECYYQASEVLENKGADDSPSLTPTEFTVDVHDKNLSPPPLIDGLTSLFEEVKFSNHEISVQQVESARSLAKKIIFRYKSSKEAVIEGENENETDAESDVETEMGERK